MAEQGKVPFGRLVIIGIATYKRPQGLRKLLESLARLEFHKVPAPIIEVVVVDNDDAEGARSVCAEMGGELNIKYMVEKERGIPFVRNAVLCYAIPISDFIAFVDDDEVVERGWLDELLHAQKLFRADVVAGPVLPVFVEPPPNWAGAGKFFERQRYRTGTLLKYAASGNVLIRSEGLQNSEAWFDNRFALSGGEDTFFFMQLAAQGAVMVWADEAVVYEWVPPTRVTPQWLCKRSFRLGATMSRCETYLASPPSVRILRAAKGFGRIGKGLVLLPLSPLLGRHTFIRALQNISRGCGSLFGLIGVRYDEYRHVHGS